MTENAQEVQEAMLVTDTDKSSPTWITLDGGTTVEGVHLISDKLIGIVNEILKLDKLEENFGVRIISFKGDGFPAGKAGMAFVDVNAIAINLEEVWSATLTALEEGVLKLSMTGIIWHELIKTTLHEIHHIDACRDSELRKLIEDDVKGADEEAEGWAGEIINDLGKTLDIEPVGLADMPFFSVKLMELMTSEMIDEDWAIRARLMLEENIMYHDEDNDITLETFREYLRGVEDPDEKDDAWEQGVSVIDLIFNMDDGSVVKTAEKLPEPIVEIVEATVETVPTAEEVVADGMTPATGALFAALPAEEETVAAIQEEVANSVPLPEHIVAEQEQVAAAAVATPSTTPTAVSYPPNGLSNETMVAFLKDVYMRLYTHIFTKGGWQLNSDQGFTNPGAVLEPVSIADLIQLHQAPGLIMEYDTLDATGHLKPEEMKGHIRGLVFSKTNQHGIPAYAIYLNINGQRVKRSLIAQNSAKLNNVGQYSSMALEARAGHAITWLLSEDENKKFIAKIRDNIYEAL